MSRIGEQRYNLLYNNCEHFATWCKTGRHRSEQVDSFLDRARNWSGLMPSALMRGLELLVQRGLLDDDARSIAKQGVEKLERLRKLETVLQQAGADDNNRLLLSGQHLADELAAIEELKGKVDALLEQPTHLIKTDESKTISV